MAEVEDLGIGVEDRVLLDCAAGISPRSQLDGGRCGTFGRKTLGDLAQPRSIGRAGERAVGRQPEAFVADVVSVLCGGVGFVSGAQPSVEDFWRMGTGDELAAGLHLAPGLVGRAFRNGSDAFESGIAVDVGLGGVDLILGVDLAVGQRWNGSAIDGHAHRKGGAVVAIHPAAFGALQHRRSEQLVAGPAHVLRHRSHPIILPMTKRFLVVHS